MFDDHTGDRVLKLSNRNKWDRYAEELLNLHHTLRKDERNFDVGFHQMLMVMQKPGGEGLIVPHLVGSSLEADPANDVRAGVSRANEADRAREKGQQVELILYIECFELCR